MISEFERGRTFSMSSGSQKEISRESHFSSAPCQ
jgi:hypothetical protein